MDGREVSRRLRPELEHYARELRERHHRAPALAAVLVGTIRPRASTSATSAALPEDLGFESRDHADDCPRKRPTERLLEEIAQLNADASAAGILLQLRYRRRSTFSDCSMQSKQFQGRRRGGRSQRERFLSCTVGPLQSRARHASMLTLLECYTVPDGRRARRGNRAQRYRGQADGARVHRATGCATGTVTWAIGATHNLLAAICQGRHRRTPAAGADPARHTSGQPRKMINPGACVIRHGIPASARGRNSRATSISIG